VKTNESKVARQYRLQQWADAIRECNNRPADLSVKDWCDQHDITPENYYYRLKEVRKACLANFPMESTPQRIVPVPSTLTTNVSTQDSFLEIVANNVSIRVTANTSKELLTMVLQVAANVK